MSDAERNHPWWQWSRRNRLSALFLSWCMLLGGFALADSAPRPLVPEIPLSDLQTVIWSTEEGLPINAVLRIIQDPDGFLWLATYEGIVRFDGRFFEVFDREDLQSRTSGFGALAQDAEGALWIGSQDGLLIRRHEGLFQVLNPEEPVRTTIHLIAPIDPQRIFFAARNRGLFLYQDGAILRPHPDLAEIEVNDLLQTPEGDILLATEGKGLLRLDKEGSLTSLDSASGAGSRPRTFYSDPDGTLWVGGPNGLFRREDDGSYTAIPQTADLTIEHLLGDGHGSLWFAAADGLYRLTAEGTLESLKEVAGQPLQEVIRLAFDREGSLWVATTTTGLLQIKQARFQNLGRENGLPTDRINVVFEDNGEVLIGNHDGTVSVVHHLSQPALHDELQNPVEILSTPEPLPELRVRDVYRDRSGVLWILTYQGATLLSEKNGEIRQSSWGIDEGLPTDQLRFVFEDSTGQIHLGTRDLGLMRWAPEDDFPALGKKDGLVTNYLLTALESRSGDVYLGGQEGMNRVRDGVVTRTWRSGSDLPGSLVFSLTEDSAGTIWVASNGGVARLQEDRLDILDESAGLSVDAVYHVQEDDLGAMWLNSSQGILRIPRNDLNAVLDGTLQSFQRRLFDEDDGMISSECTGATRFLKASDGRLWFPTMKGVAVIDPEKLPSNTVPPLIRMRTLWVDGESFTIEGKDQITLPPGSRRVRFEFSVLSFQSPNRVRARYRLDGFDNDWIDADDARSVTYTRLQPGKYRFRLLGANGDSLWSPQETALEIHQEAFLYQRPVFHFILAALLAGGILAAHRWRLAGMAAYAERLRVTVDELQRTQEENRGLINELETRNTEITRFSTAVSHDLRSPLVTIRGLLGFIEKDLQKGTPDRAMKTLKRIHSASDVMAQRLEDLSRLSRLGTLDKTFERIKMHALARRAAELVDGRVRETDALIRIQEDLPDAFGEPDRLLEVLQNLLDNAIKFHHPQRRPEIEVGWDAGRSSYFVRDNGRGIAKKDCEKVFVLFDRLNPEMEGTGVGLAMVQRIIEVHGGTICLESAGEGHGTTFFFTLLSVPTKEADA